MKHPKLKGKNFEREIAKRLSKEFKVLVRRTPSSGAIHAFMSCDIITTNQGSILYGLHIECKKRDKLNVMEAYDKIKNLAPAGKVPIVIWTKDFRDEPVVILGYRDFFNYLKVIEDLNI